MYRFIRYFNQNRKKIYRIIIIIISAFLAFRFFVKQAEVENNDKIQNALNELNQQASNKDTTYNINTESAIGEGTSSETYKEEADTIVQFIQYCNNLDTNSAYNMLSDVCKENIYPTLECFEQNYFKDNFSSNKNYQIQRWSGSTYKVNLKENALHTGIFTEESKQDFITIIKQNDEKKLNINNYIGRTKLNIQKSLEDLAINVLYKDTYREYETYTLEINNKGKSDIYLNNSEKASALYLIDTNDIKYESYSHEISREQLHIYSYSTKKIKITFSNAHISNRKISEMVFESVILNDKEEEQKISIDIKK